MSITFNDKKLTGSNIKVRRYTAAGSMVYRGDGDDTADLFDDTAAAGDWLTFALSRTNGTKFNKIDITIDTPLSASSIDIVWEYCRRGVDNYNENWYALSNVVDGTNNFANSGTVSFDVPEDWENYLRVQGNGDWYYWVVRARIVSVSGITEGGKYSAIDIYPYYIIVDEPSTNAGSPTTFDDIYNEDVANGWGVVEKSGRHFLFNCGLYVNYYSSEINGSFIRTTNEIIEFAKNWDLFNYGKLLAGDKFSGDFVDSGSSFIWNIYNGDLYGKIAYFYSKIYNSSFRFLKMDGASVAHGQWGGDLGSRAGQEIIDVYVEGLRQVRFQEKTNFIANIKGYNIATGMETPGALNKNITLFGGNYCARPESITENYRHLHQCDLSGAGIYPINPYRVTRLDGYRFVTVDCYFGNFNDEDKVVWLVSSSDTNYSDAKLLEKVSVLIKVVDESGNAISGATVKVEDKNGELFSYQTNDDGYCGKYLCEITSVSGQDITDSSQSWDTTGNTGYGELHYREYLITSGDATGERKIIYPNHTATTITGAPDFTNTPSVGDRFIIIPYITVRDYTPNSLANGYNKSTVDDKNPIKITISADGYQTYSIEQNVYEKIEWTIKLNKQNKIFLKDGSVLINAKASDPNNKILL